MKLYWLLLSAFILVPQIACMASERKNVLLIAVDDLRPDLGCYGDPSIDSPNIDALATSGRLFTRAYCQQALCNPSRTSLMTGLRPDSIGVTGNHIHFRTNHPDVVTLSQHFMRHGYHAQAIGKIFHGFLPKGTSKTVWDTLGDPPSWSVPATRFGPRYYYTESGVAQARQSYQAMYRPADADSNDQAWATKLVFGPMTEAPPVDDEILFDGKVAKHAVASLESLSKNQQPFFLAVGFIKPHSPFVAPRKYWDQYNSAEIDIPNPATLPRDAPAWVGHRSGEIRRYTDQPNSGAIPIDNQRRMIHGYRACISYVDAQIGKLLDALEKHGLAEDTVVVLFGDHGYHLGEHGLWGKTTNFELDTRVPLIIRSPGMPKAGQSTKSLAELVDLYPTLAELAGLPIGDHLEGTSLCPIINDPYATPDDCAISQYPRGKRMGYSLRTSQWRLTDWIERESGASQGVELYAYANGSQAEAINMAARHPEIVARLTNRLRREIGVPIPANSIDEKTFQQIVSVRATPIRQPVLTGVDDCPLLRITIDAVGSRQPITVSRFHFQIFGNDAGNSLRSVTLTVGDEGFGHSNQTFGDIRLMGTFVLRHGSNEFLLCCEPAETANLDARLKVSCSRVESSNGSTWMPEHVNQHDHRFGIALANSGDDGVHTYRIPGLVTTNDGTLIAVYDRRNRSSSDLPGDIDVGMSRSIDGGRTWEASRVILDMGNDPQWCYDGVGDPAILVDRQTGTIWVAATWSHGNRSWHESGPGLTPEETGQFLLVRSDDDGLTWSDPINITRQIKQPPWCFVLAGPGNGISMADGTLVFAAQYQSPPQQGRRPYSTIVYSKDHGATWEIGTGAHPDTTESQVVEIEPGRLMLNCRYDLDDVRVVMTTSDLGRSWQPHPTTKRALIEPKSCMASLINLGITVASNSPSWLLFSNPDSTELRQRITIKASPDNGMTWPKQNRLLLDQGEGRGYSCMSMIDKKTIGIIYESSRADLVFQRVAIEDLATPMTSEN